MLLRAPLIARCRPIIHSFIHSTSALLLMNGLLARVIAAASVASGVAAITQLYEHEQRQGRLSMMATLANLETQVRTDDACRSCWH